MRGSKCELAEEKTKRGGVRRRRSIKLSRRINGVFAAHFCVEFSSGAKRVVMRVTGSPVTIMGKGPGVSFLPPSSRVNSKTWRFETARNNPTRRRDYNLSLLIRPRFHVLNYNSRIIQLRYLSYRLIASYSPY